MKNVITVLLTLAFTVAFTTDSPAGGVAPRKASSIVTLSTTGVTGACAGLGAEFNTELTSDGQVATFAGIPAGEVLVVTSVDFYSGGGTAGRRYMFNFGNTNGSLVVADAGLADATGQVVGSVTIPSGVVVKSGVVICARFTNAGGDVFNAFARVHGFFTGDH
jgi:hypothetical protein